MNSETVNIKITELIGSKRAIAAEDAYVLYNFLDNALSKKEKVTIDFSDIELLLSVFLNISIGQLYAKYESEFLNNYLTNTNISEDDLTTLEKVITVAKQYFKNKNSFDDSAKRHFPDAQ